MPVKSHGMTRDVSGRMTSMYRIWLLMRNRCNNPNHPQFHLYGGRGIKVCARWDRSFTAWLADVGPRPSPQHTLDRIHNGRGYSPANVRWATQAQQVRNSRRAKLTEAKAAEARRLYAHGGWSHALLARKFGVSKPTMGALLSGRTWR